MSRLTDGFKTLIEFSLNPSVKIYEVEVQPPGIEGGGGNDTSTMRNTALRTKQPKGLMSMSDATIKVSYDPACIPEILAMVNKNQSIKNTWPDATNLTFWGWIDSFVPDSNKEGAMPMATLKVICSNQNNSGVEIAPVQG